VVDVKAGGDLADKQLIRDAMGIDRLVADSQARIALRADRATPRPTAVLPNHELLESDIDGPPHQCNLS
jgi:hypothetical protein